MDYYRQIFKRKSFHLFRNTEAIPDDELDEIQEFVKTVRPLDDSIRTGIKIVRASETNCRAGARYCIELYSEEKGNFLRNAGYMGEQIDLWLAGKNIAALWFGIGKPDEREMDGMGYVIMIAIAKAPETAFRKDMFKAKRKPLEEIWTGEQIDGVSDIVRFAPSACNTQPWIVENADGTLRVYRYKKPGKRGIMPAKLVRYYNRIDIGIFLFFLETCLAYEGYMFTGTQFEEDASDDVEKVLVAEYRISK